MNRFEFSEKKYEKINQFPKKMKKSDNKNKNFETFVMSFTNFPFLYTNVKTVKTNLYVKKYIPAELEVVLKRALNSK